MGAVAASDEYGIQLHDSTYERHVPQPFYPSVKGRQRETVPLPLAAVA
jgi:hypothetical protein